MINCHVHRISEKRSIYKPLEKSLYKTWLFQQFPLKGLQTTDGQQLSIIDTGKRNDLEGPDFADAQILIGDKIITGDVEIHIDNDDWYYHKHHEDPIYNNVILHVVINAKKNREIITQNHNTIPVLLLSSHQMEKNPTEYFCKNWTEVNEQGLQSVLKKFADIRFQRKALAIRSQLMSVEPEHYFYRILLDVLGYSRNRESFRMFADQLPLSKLYSIIDSIAEQDRIIILESALFGSAGFFDPPNSKYLLTYSDYYDGLRQHWERIQKHFKTRSQFYRWHFAGSRPANYPTRRIAALAQILVKFYPDYPAQLWINQVTSNRSFEKMLCWVRDYFQQPAGLWKNHPFFINQYGNVLIGDRRLMDLLVNVMLPFVRAIASLQNNKSLMEKAAHLNSRVPKGEIPSFIKKWAQRLSLPLKFFNRNYLIQGSIELNHRFCDLNLCKLCLLEEYANRQENNNTT